MINTKQGAWLLGVLSLITAILLCILIFVPAKKLASTEGIQVNLKAGQEISSPLKITGVVNGNGWAGFEGQVGNVKLLDGRFLEGMGKEMSSGVLVATTEWTFLPTNFETTLNFQADVAESGVLVFNNENPSGLPEKNKTFTLPVRIKAGGEINTVKVYFMNNNLDPEISCNKVFAVEREVPKTTAVATAAINELLKGPTDVEKAQGYVTAIPNGSKLDAIIRIVDGVAYVDFNVATESGGGSCSMAARTTQIQETLLQFPTITSVKLSIEGRTGDIFQP